MKRPLITPERARHFIGTWVKKTSGKPFKSGAKEDIVADVSFHPTLGITAFIMASDQTYVAAVMREPA